MNLFAGPPALVFFLSFRSPDSEDDPRLVRCDAWRSPVVVVISSTFSSSPNPPRHAAAGCASIDPSPGCPDPSPPQRIETRSKHGHGQLLRHCAWWHCVYTGTGQKEAWITDRLRGGVVLVLLVRCRGTKGAGGARKYSVLGPRISVTPKVPPFHDWRTPRIPGSTRHVYEWFYNKF